MWRLLCSSLLRNFHLDFSLNIRKKVLSFWNKKRRRKARETRQSARDIPNHIYVRTTPEKGIKLCYAYTYGLSFLENEFNKDGNILFASPLFSERNFPLSTITFYCDHYFQFTRKGKKEANVRRSFMWEHVRSAKRDIDFSDMGIARLRTPWICWSLFMDFNYHPHSFIMSRHLSSHSSRHLQSFIVVNTPGERASHSN